MVLVVFSGGGKCYTVAGEWREVSGGKMCNRGTVMLKMRLMMMTVENIGIGQ